MISRLFQSRANKGKVAEEIACSHLIKNGLKLIDKNFYSRYGEVDLIMQDQEVLVFIEVRYRKNLDYGGALESITQSKQTKIQTTARYYMQNKGREFNSRFDVVALTGNDINKQNNLSIEWIKNAF